MRSRKSSTAGRDAARLPDARRGRPDCSVGRVDGQVQRLQQTILGQLQTEQILQRLLADEAPGSASCGVGSLGGCGSSSAKSIVDAGWKSGCVGALTSSCLDALMARRTAVETAHAAEAPGGLIQPFTPQIVDFPR